MKNKQFVKIFTITFSLVSNVSCDSFTEAGVHREQRNLLEWAQERDALSIYKGVLKDDSESFRSKVDSWEHLIPEQRIKVAVARKTAEDLNYLSSKIKMLYDKGQGDLLDPLFVAFAITNGLRFDCQREEFSGFKVCNSISDFFEDAFFNILNNVSSVHGSPTVLHAYAIIHGVSLGVLVNLMFDKNDIEALTFEIRKGATAGVEAIRPSNKMQEEAAMQALYGGFVSVIRMSLGLDILMHAEQAEAISESKRMQDIIKHLGCFLLLFKSSCKDEVAGNTFIQSFLSGANGKSILDTYNKLKPSLENNCGTQQTKAILHILNEGGLLNSINTTISFVLKQYLGCENPDCRKVYVHMLDDISMWCDCCKQPPKKANFCVDLDLNNGVFINESTMKKQTLVAILEHLLVKYSTSNKEKITRGICSSVTGNVKNDLTAAAGKNVHEVLNKLAKSFYLSTFIFNGPMKLVMKKSLFSLYVGRPKWAIDWLRSSREHMKECSNKMQEVALVRNFQDLLNNEEFTESQLKIYQGYVGTVTKASGFNIGSKIFGMFSLEKLYGRMYYSLVALMFKQVGYCIGIPECDMNAILDMWLKNLNIGIRMPTTRSLDLDELYNKILSIETECSQLDFLLMSFFLYLHGQEKMKTPSI